MSFKTASLARLIDDCNKTLFLPHIQRPFVWDELQMRRLLDSVLRHYPIQTLLFWKTKDEIKCRKFMDSVEADVVLSKLYAENESMAGRDKTLVLDGQQRLQSLFALFNGGITTAGVRQDAWLDLLSGVDSDDEGLRYGVRFSAIRPGPQWYKICDLLGLDKAIDAYTLGRREARSLKMQLAWSNEDTDDLGDRVQRNVARLVEFVRTDGQIWYDELDGVSDASQFDYERVVEIFVRVNSGGTKLAPADLMFASMKEMSSDIEEDIDDIAADLQVGDVKFDADFVLKCIVVAIKGEARLRPELFRGVNGKALMKSISDEWEHVQETFAQLKDWMHQELRLRSSRMLRTENSLVPLFDFLWHNPKPSPSSRRRMVGYYYKAQLFNWFGAATDQIIERLHGVLGKPSSVGFPIKAVKAIFAGRGRAVELSEDAILGARERLMVLNIVYQEKFDATLFASEFPANEPHVDHIYPKSKLRRELELESLEINHLGNFRLVGASDNIKKGRKYPDEYFGLLKAGGCPVERHLLVDPWASNPAKLTFTSAGYRKFRDARFAALLEIVRSVVDPEIGQV